MTADVRALPQTLLRTGTDRRLLDQVLRHGRVTRAELSAATGISKPTVSEAVRRLVDGGLLDATGLQETGRRGRVGTFYSLGAAAGRVLAVELDQSGIEVWSADLAGQVRHRHRVPPTAPGDIGALTVALRTAVAALATAGTGPLRAVAVSMANPVHPDTHEVVPLPGSPFPEGLLSPGAALAGVVDAPVLVDNDVTLAALAEHRAGAAAGAGSFAYLYVGAGLGLGLYLGDRLIRGAHGLAGEIGYLPGAGTGTLAGDLADGGLGRPDAPSTDVDTVLRLLDRTAVAGAADAPDAADGDSGDARRALRTIVAVTVRAAASVAAVVDPELILLGGPVGSHPVVLPAVAEALAGAIPGPSRLGHGTLGALAPLHGALHLALDHARAAAINELTPS